MLALALSACGDDARELDAGADARPPVADGGACIVWPVEQRDAECKAMCADVAHRCAGADSGACWTECMGYGAETSYCPRL